MRERCHGSGPLTWVSAVHAWRWEDRNEIRNLIGSGCLPLKFVPDLLFCRLLAVESQRCGEELYASRYVATLAPLPVRQVRPTIDCRQSPLRLNNWISLEIWWGGRIVCFYNVLVIQVFTGGLNEVA